ncbi:MAG TPA: transcriptional regulator [Leptospiraceae bacterium]|nr:transcriptional regulator [Spirochaetaceae bacterium]HBS04230.1 transcriptional regulator [Leptospiraceae bacterium]|tara:strand:+ start:280 stop:891 length:612 start_codon:yes stop_codon:yes gene_type:complete
MPQAKSKTAKKKTAKKAAKKKASAKKTAAPKAKKKSSTAAKKADTDFTVGDYVVYPMHGVGEISAVQNQNILGKRTLCYILEIENSKMKVMIPVDSAKERGIRPIIQKKDVKKVLDLLKKDEVDTEEDWKIRYQNNQNKIRSGSIYSVAEVCRNLYKRARDKELSLMERRLYELAYSLITSELALARSVSTEEASNLISEVLS